MLRLLACTAFAEMHFKKPKLQHNKVRSWARPSQTGHKNRTAAAADVATDDAAAPRRRRLLAVRVGDPL